MVFFKRKKTVTKKAAKPKAKAKEVPTDRVLTAEGWRRKYVLKKGRKTK